MWGRAPRKFWGYGTGAYEAHMHLWSTWELVHHPMCEGIEQYREGVDVRLSNALVRQAARVSSGCTCLMLPMICSGEKPKRGSNRLIWFPRCSVSKRGNAECSGVRRWIGSLRFVGHYYRPPCIPETLKLYQSMELKKSTSKAALMPYDDSVKWQWLDLKAKVKMFKSKLLLLVQYAVPSP